MLIQYRAALLLVSLTGVIALSSVTALAAGKVSPQMQGGTATGSASEGKAYESVDAQGNVDFSDEPPANEQTKVIDIPETNTIPPPDGAVVPADSTGTADSQQSTDSQSDAGGYSNFAIVNPSADEPFDYIANGLRFAVTTVPPLLDGHRIQYLIDGKLIGAPRPELYLQANDLAPGDHRIEARIVDETGRVLRTAPVAGFNLDRASDGRFLYRSTGGNAEGVSATEGVRSTEGVRDTEGVRTTEGVRAAEGVGRRAR
ncbi:MAG TPA: DUF4124 domain-containing protein [Pseudomonadales bacterium]|nr:DUF4124 domain-containing protein [Pseudomonadales bacterium]